MDDGRFGKLRSMALDLVVAVSEAEQDFLDGKANGAYHYDKSTKQLTDILLDLYHVFCSANEPVMPIKRTEPKKQWAGQQKQPIQKSSEPKEVIDLKTKRKERWQIELERRRREIEKAKQYPTKADYRVEFDPEKKSYFVYISPEHQQPLIFRLAAYKKYKLRFWLSLSRVSWKDIHARGIQGTTVLDPCFVADYLRPVATITNLADRAKQKQTRDPLSCSPNL